MDDEKIVELFYSRREQAISELSDKYGKILKKIAYNVLNDPLDAEECVNDAYLAVWNTVPPQKPDPLLSYVCRIVRNLALKRYGSNKAKKRNSEYDICLDEIEDCVPSSSSVEEELEAKETASHIDGFLQTLDERSRITFVLRYYHSYSVCDIADMFHTTGHSVSVRLSRIRKALKKYLTSKGVSL